MAKNEAPDKQEKQEKEENIAVDELSADEASDREGVRSSNPMLTHRC